MSIAEQVQKRTNNLEFNEEDYLFKRLELHYLKNTNYLITKFENERCRTGFKNPNGKNMCWLNASLQAIITLPVFNELVHSIHNNYHYILFKIN